MSAHTFSLPPAASGLDFVITNEAGTEVDSGTLGSSEDVVVLSVDLPWGPFYTATAGSFSAQGEVQEELPGASETAYFEAVYTGTTLNNFDDVDLVLREGHPVRDWAPLVGGKVALSPEAGGCVASLRFQTNLDFSGASTLPDGPGDVGAYAKLQRDGQNMQNTDVGVFVDPATGAPGTYSLDESAAAGGFCFGGLISAQIGAYGKDTNGDNIVDGVAVTRMLVNITRIAPAPGFDE